MLGDINNRRPDRQLERNLIFLAYAIMFLSLSLLSFFIYPQYSFYILVAVILWNIVCILITIRILKVSEHAIGFGALASEILKDKTTCFRVDNAKGEAILANKPAVDFFQDSSILSFLENNIIDSAANKLDLQKLTSAVNKLQETTVVLSINPKKNSVFVAAEWLRITVKPIYLNKTDIFEDEYSLKKIHKESYIFWTVENITSYKNMEEIFAEEKASLHNFLDFLAVGLYTCDRTGKIEYINNTLADYLNVDKNTAIGKTIDEFVAYQSENMSKTEGYYDGNVVFKTADGTSEAFVKQVNIRENNELKIRGVVMWNLPNDKQLKEDLNQMTDRFDGVFNSAPVGIILTDEHQKISLVNNQIAEIFCKDKEKILGSDVSVFFDAPSCGKIKNVLNSKTAAEMCTRFETSVQNIEQDKNIQVVACPLKHHFADQNQDGLVIYIEDATNKRNLEMQVAQAQKMQAFGQLAGGVAHDFNNLLTAVIGYCDLLIQRHGVGDPSFSDLVQLKQNANRAAGVARQLLAISRKQPLNPKLIDVTEAFAEIDHLLVRLVGDQIKVQISYGTDLGYIRVDPVQFSQVMINLAINAKDAMNGKGVLNIATRSERLNQPYQFGADIVKPGDFVVISVTDTGCGIPAENINRIFEPFFSTKKNVVGSGTGLGLAMVYGIVRQTEGFIKVASEVGKGTTFEIYLPAYENNITPVATVEEQAKDEVILDKSGKAALKTLSDPVASYDDKMILGLNVSVFDSKRALSQNTQDVKILFVEDEDAVRTVGARGLRRKGFNVVDCISAENALEHIENGEHFDMMITDMMMPGMSGAELVEIVHQKQPEMLIILASGYSEEIARKELAGSKDFYFMSKPYSLGDLHKKVMEVLANHDQ
ncbi:MAG: response regulator [Alphaproteobacteria bacterium]|nr:response regulator [Alphaproteobacteria bacterium]